MIDLLTILFVYAIINAICAFVLGLLWRQNRTRFAGPGFWLVGSGLQLVAIILTSFRGTLPDLLSVVLPNGLIIAAAIVLLAGLEHFVGRHRSHTHNIVLLAIFTGFHIWFTLVQPNLLTREIGFSLALIFVLAQGVWLMLRRVDVGLRPATRNVGQSLLAICLVAAARIGPDLMVYRGNDLLHLDAYDTLYILANLVLLIVLTFSLFLMVNRRIFDELEHDINKYRQMEETLSGSEQRYRSLFDHMLDGFAYCKMIYQDGDPSDFIYLEVNQAFEKLTGLGNVVGKKVSEIIPGLREANPGLFDTYGRVASTGRSDQLEIYLDNLKAWFLVSVYSTEPGYFTAVFENITERRRIENELKASQRLAEELYESAPDALVTVKQDGIITRINTQAQTLFGYTREELLGRPIEVLVPGHAQARHLLVQNEFFAKPHTRPMGAGLALSALKKDGLEFPVEIALSPLQLGEELFVTADIRDVSDRKQMEQVLEKRNSILATLHQMTLEIVNRHEMDDILRTLLARIGVMLDATDVSVDLVEENNVLVTRAVSSHQPLQQGDRMRRGEGGWLSWQAIESGKPAILDDYAAWSRRRPLYEGYPIHAIMIIPVHQRERVIGAINISRSEANKPFEDTDVYLAEQLAELAALVLDNAQLYSELQLQLAESFQRETALQAAQEQLIAQQRTMAMFEERQRMARDLHDSVNQSIHSLVLFSETLVSSLEKNNVSRARHISERLQESARQALKETRLLLYQTQALVNDGSINLIDELNARLAAVELRAGVRAQITLEGSLQDCPEAWSENIFRIAIEALNNSLKHAQARNVQIIIRCSPQSVEFEVLDNGRGFDTGQPGSGGYGLRNMQERADMLGGKLVVTSSPGRGTSVLFRAVIKEQ